MNLQVMNISKQTIILSNFLISYNKRIQPLIHVVILLVEHEETVTTKKDTQLLNKSQSLKIICELEAETSQPSTSTNMG